MNKRLMALVRCGWAGAKVMLDVRARARFEPILMPVLGLIDRRGATLRMPTGTVDF